MKLARFAREPGQAGIGLVVEGGIVEVARHLPGAPKSMAALLEQLEQFRGELGSIAEREPDHELGAIELLAPVERPGKIMAIGLNYADHVEESGLERPSAQMWFAKMPNALSGPNAPVPLPKVSEQLDYEAELVAVIGRRCRHVAKSAAADMIAGYAVGNDFSVRDWQRKTTQFLIGKSFDGHAPVGPWITTSDEVDPHALDISCRVNGEVRQSSNTRHLIFDVYDMVEELSKAMTLEPGDLIFTGTPGGVAAAMRPPRWLEAGDVVRVEIKGLGHIENRIQPESA
jgi:2-keto-4-pentenoate hydratase/2-oxohepta-3-ene-1,7-dioic acid hydratase in catechol pathway